MFDTHLEASSRQHIICYFVAYLNSGSALSASFVPPGSSTLLPVICSLLNGTTTKCSPMPRKPPTDSTANRTLSLGSTRRSSTSPIFSLASLTTGLPTIFDERYPAASFWTSTRSITVCGAPCAQTGPANRAVLTIAAPATKDALFMTASSYPSLKPARQSPGLGSAVPRKLNKRDSTHLG